MKTERKKAHSSRMRALAVVGASGIAFGMSVFALIREDSQDTPVAIGTLERREHRVKRKPAHSSAWKDALLRQTLSSQDAIRTGNGGTATVKLLDGRTLELGERTFAVLDPSSPFSLASLQGTAILQTPYGAHQLSVGADGKRVIRELPIRPEAPLPFQHLLASADEQTRVDFRWALPEQLPQAPKDLWVQISADAQFARGTTRSIPVSPSEKGGRGTVMLPIGSYHWRIADSQGEPLSPTRRFFVESPSPAQLVQPGAGIELSTLGERGSVDFQWEPQRFLAEGEQDARIIHELEVSLSPDFRQPFRTERIALSSGSTRMEGLPTGTIYWRILGRSADTRSASEPRSFVLKRTQQIDLHARAPLDRSYFTRPREVHLRWESSAVPGTTYRWQVATEDGSVLAEERTTSLSATWRFPKPGRYRWRVLSLRDQAEAGSSPWQAFAILDGSPLALRAPAAEAQALFWEEPLPVEFTWEEDARSKNQGLSQILEIAQDPGMRQLVKVKRFPVQTTSSGKIALPDGEARTYYWRLKWLDANGNLVNTSPIRSLKYGTHPPLLAPLPVIAGGTGTVYDLSETESPPHLKWSTQEGARQYEVRVWKEGGDLRKPAFTIKTRDPSILLWDLEEGSYRWSVRAIDRLLRPGAWLPEQSIRISHGEP